jgi:hypothetical protein
MIGSVEIHGGEMLPRLRSSKRFQAPALQPCQLSRAYLELQLELARFRHDLAYPAERSTSGGVSGIGCSSGSMWARKVRALRSAPDAGREA